MRLWIPLALLVAGLSTCGDPAGPESTDVALTGVTVLDGTDGPARAQQTVVIQDGVIRAIGPDGSVPLPTEGSVLELAGRWVTPGFVDTHTHMPGQAADQDRFLRTLLAFGITTARSTAAAPQGGIDLRARLESGAQVGPRFRTAGRLIDAPGSIWPTFGSVVASEAEIRAEVERQADQGVDLIKLYALLPPDWVRAAVETAHARGLPVVGHLGRSSWTEAVLGGIDELTHSCFWGMAHSLVPRADSARFTEFFAPNAAFDPAQFSDWNTTVSLTDARFQEWVAATAAEGTTLSPNLVLCEAVIWGDDPTTFQRLQTELDVIPHAFPHPYSAEWPASSLVEAKAAFATFLAMIGEAHRGGVVITAGSDTMNPWMTPGPSFHRELELLAAAGIPPNEVLQIATRNGAASMGLLNETGTLEVGRSADLVVLGSDPLLDISHTRDIELVIRGGTVFRPRDLLRRDR